MTDKLDAAKVHIRFAWQIKRVSNTQCPDVDVALQFSVSDASRALYRCPKRLLAIQTYVSDLASEELNNH